MIFRTFDNREVNLEIDNEIEKSIKAKIKTISILRIFTSNFDNSILMFEKIVKAARAAHQTISFKKKKN